MPSSGHHTLSGWLMRTPSTLVAIASASPRSLAFGLHAFEAVAGGLVSVQ
jgi:hypothetical protein